MKILVSACLAGENCKYNGGNNRSEKVLRLAEENEVVTVCPEQLGGLPTPRVPAEICNGVVTAKDGKNVDREFRAGAEACLEIARRFHPDLVILQSRSPSCGVKQRYDGTFTGTLVDGAGVAADLLRANAFRIVDVEDLLVTDRLFLRKWAESDAEVLYEYAKDPAVGPIAGWPPHQNIEESLAVIRNVLSGPECYAVCRQEDGLVIGCIELMLAGHNELVQRENECELGYWLGKPYWGNGFMPEAAKEMIRHGFEDLGMEKIWCRYYDGNDKSRRVQEKCGFKYLETFRDVDVPLMGEKRTEHRNLLVREDWLSCGCPGFGGKPLDFNDKLADRTLEYYEKNADAFVAGTLAADMSVAREKFLARIAVDAAGSAGASGRPGADPADIRILDFGCGSGRDTKVFLEAGYAVDACDGSAELVRKASEFTGIAVKQMLFQELDAVEAYDGVWACSSILHLPKNELLDVMKKIAAALKPGGILYTSFKYGTFEGERNGRYFTDFTEETLAEFLTQVPVFKLLESWITQDVRPGRDEQWVNVLVKRII